MHRRGEEESNSRKIQTNQKQAAANNLIPWLSIFKKNIWYIYIIMFSWWAPWLLFLFSRAKSIFLKIFGWRSFYITFYIYITSPSPLSAFSAVKKSMMDWGYPWIVVFTKKSQHQPLFLLLTLCLHRLCFYSTLYFVYFYVHHAN